MNADEALRLIEAGFTAEEIRNMQAEAGNEPPADESTEPKPGAGSSEHAGKIEEPKQTEPPKSNETVEELKATIKELSTTIKNMQESNIKNASGGEPAAKTRNDIMKDFMSKF